MMMRPCIVRHNVNVKLPLRPGEVCERIVDLPVCRAQQFHVNRAPQNTASC